MSASAYEFPGVSAGSRIRFPGNGDAGRYGSELVELLDDTEPAVRRAAHASLVRLLGTDASPGEEGTVAQRKWRDALRSRGLVRQAP